MQKVFLTYIF